MKFIISLLARMFMLLVAAMLLWNAHRLYVDDHVFLAAWFVAAGIFWASDEGRK